MMETEAEGSLQRTLNMGGSENETADDLSTRAKITANKLTVMFSDSYRAQSEYRDQIVDDLKCSSGNQWPEEILKDLPPNMAPMVINKMLMPMLFLSGVHRQTRQEPKLVPFEGGDQKSAELMNALVHWQEETYDADMLDEKVFLHKIMVGLGWWKYFIDYSYKDIEGCIKLQKRHPLTIFPDPNWLDNEWEDAEYVIDAQWYTPDKAASLWPKYADEFRRMQGEWLRTTQGKSGATMTGLNVGDTLSEERLFFDPVTKRVRVGECWYKLQKKITVALNQQTQEVQTDEQLVKRLKVMVKLLPPEQVGQWTFIPRTVNLVRCAYWFYDTLLEDEESPYEEHCFPVFPSLGIYLWKHPMGLATMTKDLQREKNKRRSKLIELVGRMPQSGWLINNAEVKAQEDAEKWGAGNGIVIGYDKEPPVQVRPPDLPMATIRLEEKSDEEIKDVINVHDELLGQATQKTISGRAIEARQRGGLISHEHFFDSFNKEKKQRIKFLIGLIKQFVSPTKALRILGTIAQRQPDSQVGQMMAQAQDPMQLAMMDIQQMLSEAFDAEYDVVITSRPAEPSLNMQAWQELSELKQGGAEIPPQLLWETAAKAGLITEDDVREIMQFIQQQQQAAMAPPPPGMPPPGPPPAAGMPQQPAAA